MTGRRGLASRSAATARRRVVLDIRLPGMDGWEVLAALKADPATAATPVVIVSMLDERLTGLALGAADYLVKPVSREQVLRRAGPGRRAAASPVHGPVGREGT